MPSAIPSLVNKLKDKCIALGFIKIGIATASFAACHPLITSKERATIIRTIG